MGREKLNMQRVGKAFTLAEIMVVLFVMSIILAAFAPMMTTRTKVNKTSPWEWATPDSANTFFGANANQRVLIGQKTKGSDAANKLTINPGNATNAHILFKNPNSSISDMILNINSTNLFLSTPPAATFSAIENTVIGHSAGRNLTTGNYNTMLGYNAGNNLSTGGSNTILGVNAGHSLTTGGANTLQGDNAGGLLTTGSYNTIAGYYAGYKLTAGFQNSIMGIQAGYNLTSGTQNTLVGDHAAGALTAGSGNVAIGAYALQNVTTGSNNVAVGLNACTGLSGDVNRTSCFGWKAGPNEADTTENHIYIGNAGSQVHILHNLKVSGYLEAASSNITSDARLKNIKGENTAGLNEILKIKPVSFTFKDDKKQTPRVGVLAQDLQKIFPNAVTKGDDGYLRIRMEDMFYAMINAIKELANISIKIEKRVDDIDNKQKELEERIRALEEKVN